MLNKFDPRSSPAPAYYCGHPEQTIHHIINECLNRIFDASLGEISDVNRAVATNVLMSS